MKVVTWTAAWANPASPRGRAFLNALNRIGADVMCVTEGSPGLLPSHGYVISSDQDYGYHAQPYRRKVLLWSNSKWTSVECAESTGMPSGRLVSGITEVGGWRVRVVGVCVPWKDAHVRTGRRDRRPWVDHVLFLQVLTAYLDRIAEPVVVLGDFNQRVPRLREPLRVAGALSEALGTRFEVVTRNRDRSEAKSKIDHIAISATLRATELRPIPNSSEGDTRVSDRPGWSVEIEIAGSRQNIP